jgi:sRNA-binding protein
LTGSRGIEESPQQITALREQWPLAFPVKPHDVRPLAIGAVGEIAAAMGVVGVVHARRARPLENGHAYCRAVL